MRHASPVGVTSAGGSGWRWMQALLAAAAAASAAGWVAAMSGAGAVLQAAAAIVAAVLAAAVAWHGARPRSVHLQWDGNAWSADGARGAVAVAVDFGGWLLLRFQPADSGRVRWLPLARAGAGVTWHGLRAALHARTTPEPQA